MNNPECKTIDTNGVETNLKQWLQDQAKHKHYQLKYLLAHADDGVIWGRFESDGTLITQTEPENLFLNYNFAKLRWLTLQQCRIFSKNAEVMLWKVNGQPKARLVTEPEGTEYICEPQILWGTHGEKREDKCFTLLSDGQQGLRHAVPFTDIDLEGDRKLKNRVRLEVRHYTKYDDSGVGRIYLSRLVDIHAKPL